VETLPEPMSKSQQLLTGSFQMMWMETVGDILATLGDARREYESSEEPTPRLNKFGQDP
jgi:hypothetical protein